MIPLTGGLRYYFDTKNAPKAIAVANPYLAGGIGFYLRGERVIQNTNPGVYQFSVPDTTTSNFGFYGGGGVEFLVYKRHIYLGLDSRFHMVFFPDSASGIGLPSVFRDGNYVSVVLSLTYNF